jgi:hypothetical protein
MRVPEKKQKPMVVQASTQAEGGQVGMENLLHETGKELILKSPETLIFVSYTFRMPLKSTFSLFILLVLVACNSSEVKRLQVENDSLRNELNSQQTTLKMLVDISVWLDSIDANRSALVAENVTSPEALSERLQDINEFVKRSEQKIQAIEKALKSSNRESSAYLMMVDALKGEVQFQVDQVSMLNEKVRISNEENAGLKENIRLKDGEISRQASAKEQELRVLRQRIQAMEDNVKVANADAIYERAKAAEAVARKTKLAPRKKREAYDEAVQLYRKALSLGKSQAKDDLVRLKSFE